MKTRQTLVLGRADIVQTMQLSDYIEAVEQAFKQSHDGLMLVPDVVHIPAPDGAFHIKSAGVVGDSHYVAVKVNGNFPNNPKSNGLPTIQGAIILCDGRDGSLLAVIDSIEVTAMRTGAATAVAAKYLAQKSASVITIIGCGIQGRVQLRSLAEVLPLATVYAYDQDEDQTETFAAEMRSQMDLDIIPVENFVDGTRASQVIVTCTSSRRPFLDLEHVEPGTFVGAIGADNDDKQELHPNLLTRSKLVVDVIDQCAGIGELHHALDANAISRSDVYAELGGIVAGSVSANLSPDDITVFDSTGSAIQDVAAAAIIYERAKEQSIGLRMEFA